MLPDESANCSANGISDILELKLGYDGIVLARSRLAKDMKLSLAEIYLALAAEIPVLDADTSTIAVISNPYKKWSEINPALPDEAIQFYGPPLTSGTRDAFDELVLGEGCYLVYSRISETAANTSGEEENCTSIRTDNAYTEIGENDNLIIQRLQTNDTAIGIIGFNFLNRNNVILSAIPISHDTSKAQLPTSKNITNGNYPISRNLYLYVRKDQITSSSALTAYLEELISEDSYGGGGYLVQEGLVPLTEINRSKTVASIKKITKPETALGNETVSK
jgi:phosphate transport system substrate-binding protein